ncbi:MAG: hypothetical protein HC923_06565, partial [Myxococcales bacterium]|nr:hypothetical protein [Myxococcales bacterium]
MMRTSKRKLANAPSFALGVTMAFAACGEDGASGPFFADPREPFEVASFLRARGDLAIFDDRIETTTTAAALLGPELATLTFFDRDPQSGFLFDVGAACPEQTPPPGSGCRVLPLTLQGSLECVGAPSPPPVALQLEVPGTDVWLSSRPAEDA